MVSSVRVVSIEPMGNYRRLVTLRDEGENEYTIIYGDSVSEDAILRRAPRICRESKRRKRN